MITLRSLLSGLTAVSASATIATADIKINEIRSDHPGTDINEYVEIFSDSGSESLDGMTLVVLGDSSNGSGVVEKVLPLDGLTASPFLVLAPESFAIPGASGDAILPSNFFETSDNLTVMIVTGFTGALFDDLDTDDDGNLDSTPWTSIVDAVAIIEEMNPPTFTEFEYATGLGFPTVGPGDGVDFFGGPTTPGHVYRTADGAGMWTFGPFDVFDFEAEDTPGFSNVVDEELSLVLGTNSISENGGTTTLEVSLDSPASGDVTIVASIANFDATEVTIPEIVIPSGTSSRTVTLTAVDDAWRDFDQTVSIRTKAFGYFRASIDLTVTDDETGDPSGLRVNELHPDPGDDANFDGDQNAQEDEFVEIVNDSESQADLSGYELYDGSALRHTFPAGTLLDPGCAIVVFGGGDFTEGQSIDFLGAILQKASEGSVALNNSGDTVRLLTPGGVEVAGHSYGEVDGDNGSLTMSPDLNATNEFTTHLVASGITSSPGSRVDITAFCAFSELTLAVLPDTIIENAGAMASVLTITRNGDTSGALTVNLSGDDSEISIPATAEFGAGQSEITVDIDAVDDTAADGDQPVTITASAAGYLDGMAVITVQDDGDVNNSTLFINEVDYDMVGADADEYIEIYDGGAGNTALDGHVLVLYNGNGGSVYRTISLDGESTDANGFAVIGTPSNGIQNGAPDGLALFTAPDPSAFNGTDISSIPAGAVIVDSLVYERGNNGILDPLGYTGPDLSDSNSEVISLSRIPDGGTWQTSGLTRGTSNGGGGGSDYDAWAAGFPGLGGPTADDDNDCLDNLTEYALGKNPEVPDIGGNPSVAEVGGELQLSVTKGSEAAADPDFSYVVEVSTDLINWSTADTNVITDDATTLLVSYTGAASEVFMRLRVELQ